MGKSVRRLGGGGGRIFLPCFQGGGIQMKVRGARNPNPAHVGEESRLSEGGGVRRQLPPMSDEHGGDGRRVATKR